MYKMKNGIKRHPEKRWNLPDRVFFAHGGCHILAGEFLKVLPLSGFYAERIIVDDELAGNHIWVTDDHIAFDYRGYSNRTKMIQYHTNGWAKRYDNWHCSLKRVDFDLHCQEALNARMMLGPSQYFGDPIKRANKFIDKIDHKSAYERALSTL